MKYGKLSRQLTALAGPIFIETLLVMMLGAVDTFMLSRYSDNSVAAVGVVNQLMNLVFLLFEVMVCSVGIFPYVIAVIGGDTGYFPIEDALTVIDSPAVAHMEIVSGSHV